MHYIVFTVSKQIMQFLIFSIKFIINNTIAKDRMKFIPLCSAHCMSCQLNRLVSPTFLTRCHGCKNSSSQRIRLIGTYDFECTSKYIRIDLHQHGILFGNSAAYIDFINLY